MLSVLRRVLALVYVRVRISVGVLLNSTHTLGVVLGVLFCHDHRTFEFIANHILILDVIIVQEVLREVVGKHCGRVLGCHL